MKRKIAYSFEGTFYDHRGWDFTGEAKIYEDGDNWVIRDKYKSLYYRNRIFFIKEPFYVEIPKNNKHRVLVNAHLEQCIKEVHSFLKGNPISASYNAYLKQLLDIKSSYFTNSIDFITRG
jgi:hypothetical protein